ncbi:DUF2911 domain-containing protein [Pontibacter ruber]|uniref:DUF2911 domain-containing protein n=1 Tax=Pontibacter ruber TaxID=1343895 RepID=A0ABW5CVM5_9BACT|nr:DUF2911 domain-containing protein [Pontibacter ruber]
MKNTRLLTSFVMLFICMLVTTTAWAQGQKQKASPADSTSGKIGTATITINYSSPSVKGRTIWGELVPYGKVWRAGANEATRFTTDQDIMVAGKLLPAGTYSFYTIPNKDQWTIIFNKTARQWGTEYDQKQDALRVTAKPRTGAPMSERLTYAITKDGMVLRWETLEVPVPIKPAKK